MMPLVVYNSFLACFVRKIKLQTVLFSFVSIFFLISIVSEVLNYNHILSTYYGVPGQSTCAFKHLIVFFLTTVYERQSNARRYKYQRQMQQN